MALLDEVKAEVVQKKSASPIDQNGDKVEPKPKRTRRRRNPEDMTKEEREAWLQKKRDEEEARCMGLVKRRRRRKSARTDAAHESGDCKPRQPKVLQPLEILHLLRIPGLPKGDCLAICYVRGVDS